MKPQVASGFQLAALRARLNGRAAGAWEVVGGRLEQIAFDAAPDLSADVACRFAEATRSVDLIRVELAIARAATTARPIVSITDELPQDVGSGYWLRAFGAARSVAVPIGGPGGGVGMVVSVALGLEPDADTVAALISQRFRSPSE